MGAVVTGLGVIAGALAGGAQLGDALRASSMPLHEVDRSAGYHLPQSARLMGTTSGVDLTPWISARDARRMSRASRLAVAAARMAGRDAHAEVAGAATAVILSSAFSAADSTEQLLRATLDEGPETASPFLFAESVANAPAAQIAIAMKAEGKNITIPQREAGVLTAVGRGAAEIASGRANVVLAGGVEEITPLLHALLDRFESLARPGHPAGEVARPFDRCRHGFVVSEGAVVVVIEDEDAARARGASIRARVRQFAGAFDPTAPRVGWGRGVGPLSSALKQMLDRAGVGPQDIGRIVSGASGSVAGDRLEARVLRSVWNGTPMPPVLAPKSVTGEYGGGFLGAAILAAGGFPFGATAGFRDVDPELQMVPHDGRALPDADLTLVTSLASGGSASFLLLERVA